MATGWPELGLSRSEFPVTMRRMISFSSLDSSLFGEGIIGFIVERQIGVVRRFLGEPVPGHQGLERKIVEFGVGLFGEKGTLFFPPLSSVNLGFKHYCFYFLIIKIDYY